MLCMIDWLVSTSVVQANSDETQWWWSNLRRTGAPSTVLAAALVPDSLGIFSDSILSNGRVSAMFSHQLLGTSITQQSCGGKYAR